MSIKDAERVTMQATPLNNPAGRPNDRDTADPRVIPGPDHDKKNSVRTTHPQPSANAPTGHDGSPSIAPHAAQNAMRLNNLSQIAIAESEEIGTDEQQCPSKHFGFTTLYGDRPQSLYSRLHGYDCDRLLILWIAVDRKTMQTTGSCLQSPLPLLPTQLSLWMTGPSPQPALRGLWTVKIYPFLYLHLGIYVVARALGVFL